MEGTLSFKPIPVDKKIEAASKVVSGKKIQPVAKEIGVHRSSVYVWKERALSTLEKALEPHKEDSKFKHLQKTPGENIRDLRKKIDKLN